MSLILRIGDSPGQVDRAQSSILGAPPCAPRALSPGKSRWELMDVTWMTWTGSWGSCPRISSQPQHRLTVAEPQLLLRVTVTHLPPTCLSLFVSLVFVVGLRAGETLWALRPLSHSQICIN